jgi:gluconokinase
LLLYDCAYKSLTLLQYHPPSNVAKMSNDIPLEDADRWDWLINIREAAVAALESGAAGVVVTCSALKKKYRDVIRIASINEHRVHVHFLFLALDEATLIKRIEERSRKTGHFMKATMVQSQLADLELPSARETDVIKIDATGTMTENYRLVKHELEAVLS